MNNVSEKRMWDILQQYIDGELSEQDALTVSNRVATDEVWKAAYDEALYLRDLLQSRSLPEPDRMFWQRLSLKLAEPNEAENHDESLLHHLSPAAIVATIVVFIGVGAFAYFFGGDLYRFVRQNSEQAQLAYEEGLREWIMPLFEKTDKDKVLEFAMFGTLPLDEEKGTVLRLDTTTVEGFRIELARAPKAQPKIQLDDLYGEVRATKEQQSTIDTLMRCAQKEIESAFLVAHDKSLAISSELPSIHERLLSGVVSTLDPQQRKLLARYLDARNTAFTFIASPAEPAAPPSAILRRVQTPRPVNEYVVFSMDSTRKKKIELDVARLRTDMERNVRHVVDAEAMFEAAAKTYAIKSQEFKWKHVPPSIREEEDMIRIELRRLQSERKQADEEQIIRARVIPRNIYRRIEQLPEINTQLQFHFKTDSASFHLNLDSIIEKAMESIPAIEIEVRDLERQIRQQRLQPRSKQDTVRIRRTYPSPPPAPKPPPPPAPDNGDFSRQYFFNDTLNTFSYRTTISASDSTRPYRDHKRSQQKDSPKKRKTKTTVIEL